MDALAEDIFLDYFINNETKKEIGSGVTALDPQYLFFP